MATIQYTAADDHGYTRFDDIFDIGLLRTEEGLIIDVHEPDEFELLGALELDNPALQETKP